MTDYSMQVRVGGTATAHRGPLPYSNYCDGPCTYTATGSQRITITPLEADLDFKATFGGARKDHFFLPPFVSYYQMIFTDSTFPRGMPRGNFNHTWTRADPTYPGHPYWKLTENTCYAGNLYCAVNIKETGIMTSTTRVNGVVHTDSVTIYCADSLPELNNDLVRQGLMAVLDSSGAGIDSTTSIYARNERGFFILQDTTVPGSKPFIWLLPEKPHADACQYGGKFPEFSERPAGTLVLGWGHSHPGVRWENVMCTDTLGNPRTFWQNGELKVWTSDLTPGVSTSDFEEQQRRNDPNYPQYQGPIDEYFIQSDGTLLILRPGQLPMAPYNLPSQNIRWRTGRCAWPRRTI